MAKKKKSKKNTELAGSRVKLDFKKHILPPLAGLFVAVLVFGFFNSSLISARVAYYFKDKQPTQALSPQEIVSAVDKNAPPQILIDNINVKAPVIFDQQTVNEAAFQKALRNGVVHYPGTANPGEQGNVVIFGHSSGQWWAPGDYKFVFTLLDKLVIHDKIFVEYQGTRYIYEVYNTQVVPPTEVSVLNQSGAYNLTLITCSPVGTSSKRLIIQAQQISPKAEVDKSYDKAATSPTGAKEHNLPSNSGSFWHDLRELF